MVRIGIEIFIAVREITINNMCRDLSVLRKMRSDNQVTIAEVSDSTQIRWNSRTRKIIESLASPYVVFLLKTQSSLFAPTPPLAQQPILSNSPQNLFTIASVKAEVVDHIHSLHFESESSDCAWSAPHGKPEKHRELVKAGHRSAHGTTIPKSF